MISICIPTYEQGGFGAKHLNELFYSILEQEGVEYKVIVSDNSRDNGIKEICGVFKKYLNVKYILNHKTFGVSANTNNAIEAASGNIKIMYQDDVFLTKDALKLFSEALNRNEWVVSGHRQMNANGRLGNGTAAKWSNRIIQGQNSVGMPSVIAMRQNKFKFDTNLTTLLDCEFYWLLYKEFGEPGYIPNQLIGLRYWNGSVSLSQKNTRVKDYEYLKIKHGAANLVCQPKK